MPSSCCRPSEYPPEAVARSLDTEAVSHALTRVLGPGIAVEGAARVTGGASRETWLFDAVRPDGTREALVLRRDPGDTGSVAGGDRATEYRLLAAASEAGVAVPDVVLLLDDADGLGHGFVMRRVDGETIPRRILRDDTYATARPLLASQCGTIAARIHSVPVASLPALACTDGPAQVVQWRDILDSFDEAHPAFELALRWLAAHAPAATENPTLVHGDFRNGNIIVGPEGVRAVLDWELAHLGDPIEDLGWLCVRAWRFGHTDMVVGGFGTVDSLLASYAAAGGTPPSLDELRWWTALGTFKWGVMCMLQTFTHLRGLVRSVELAAIGRRVAENEHDLLVLLDGGW